MLFESKDITYSFSLSQCLEERVSNAYQAYEAGRKEGRQGGREERNERKMGRKKKEEEMRGGKQLVKLLSYYPLQGKFITADSLHYNSSKEESSLSWNKIIRRSP